MLIYFVNISNALILDAFEFSCERALIAAVEVKNCIRSVTNSSASRK